MARTELMDAALHGEIDRVTALLNRGADPNTADERGWTALVYAVMDRRPDVVEMLLRAGAEVNRPAQDGATPLMKATLWGDVGCVAALLRGGANPALVDAEGWTAEAMADAAGHEEIVRLLRGRRDAAARTGGMS